MPPITPPTAAAGHAAGNAADHAGRGRGWRQLFFLNHGDVFGDRFGRHQVSGVELARNDFHHFYRRCRGRWRRRRRRRRSHQKTGQLRPWAAHRNKSSESGSQTPISAIWPMNDTSTVQVLLVFPRPSTNVCSNIIASPSGRASLRLPRVDPIISQLVPKPCFRTAGPAGRCQPEPVLFRSSNSCARTARSDWQRTPTNMCRS